MSSGVNHCFSKFNIEQLLTIYTIKDQPTLYKHHKTSNSVISRIKSGKSYKHIYKGIYGTS